jgi:hypothetical protein
MQDKDKDVSIVILPCFMEHFLEMGEKGYLTGAAKELWRLKKDEENMD